MNIIHGFLACAIFPLLYWATLSSSAQTYTVKPGDTLSHHIAGVNIPGPVWGKKGSLKKILKLNPNVKDPNRLMPGQTLNLNGLILLPPGPAPLITPTPKPIEVLETPPRETPLPEVSTFLKPRSFFMIAPFYGQANLIDTDLTTIAGATIATQYQAGMHLGLIHTWNDRWSSSATFKFRTVSFQPGGSVAFLQKTMSTFGFELGSTFALSSKLKLSLNVTEQKEFFIATATESSIAVDAIYVPTFGSRFDYDLVRVKQWMFGISGNLNLELPVSTPDFQINPGTSFGGSLYLNLLTADQYTQAGIELVGLSRSQNTSLVQQSEKDVVIQLKYFIPIK